MPSDRKKILFVFVCALVTYCCGTSQAEIIFTSNVKADFTFTTVGTTLGLPDQTELPFTAFGALTFRLDNSVANATSMNFLGATGRLTVASPAGFAGATMGPYSFTGGQLQGITYGAGGNIIGGDVVSLSMLWEMQLGNTRLYTKAALPFGGRITGAPFGVGDIISNAAPFDVFLDNGNPATDPLVVIGKDRFLTITAVPEPSSLALLVLGGIGMIPIRRYRMRKRFASTMNENPNQHFDALC